MPVDIRERCFKLRCKSKRGERMHEDENAFLVDCWHRWPKEYAEMSESVFEATKPFGSY